MSADSPYHEIGWNVEKSLGSLGVLGRTQHEVDRVTRGINGPVEVIPLLLDPDIRLIDAVGVVRRFQQRSTTLSSSGA